MDFKNRLKGNITQSLVETLLEDVQYRIVPLGIEEVIREVTCLNQEQYINLNLSSTLRKLPDFFIAKKDLSKTWLVEVKYRNRWNEEVKDKLKEQLFEQVKLWTPIYLVLFIKESVRKNITPASHLAVGKLVIENEQFGVLSKTYQTTEKIWIEKFIPWNEVTWDDFERFQDVFKEVANRWEDSTLARAIEIMSRLED